MSYYPTCVSSFKIHLFFAGTRKPISVRKQTTSPATDGVPVRKHSPTSNLCLGVKKNHVPSITQKPLRDRITHLLALKAYQKPELIVWLEREKANPKDKAELSCILDQVRKKVHHSTFGLHVLIWRLTIHIHWKADSV